MTYVKRLQWLHHYIPWLPWFGFSVCLLQSVLLFFWLDQCLEEWILRLEWLLCHFGSLSLTLLVPSACGVVDSCFTGVSWTILVVMLFIFLRGSLAWLLPFRSVNLLFLLRLWTQVFVSLTLWNATCCVSKKYLNLITWTMLKEHLNLIT